VGKRANLTRTRLNGQVHADVCRVIEKGGTVEMAAAVVGIHAATVYRWLKRGREAETGVHREFAIAVEDARKKCAARWVVKLQDLADQRNDWKGYAWLLERRFPEWFADPAKAGAGGVNVQVNNVVTGAGAPQGVDVAHAWFTSIRDAGGVQAVLGEDLQVVDVEAEE